MPTFANCSRTCRLLVSPTCRCCLGRRANSRQHAAATPGKRIMGLRVASRDGGRLKAEAVFSRNAMRELEVFLPLSVLGARASEGGVDSWLYLLGFVWAGVFGIRHAAR